MKYENALEKTICNMLDVEDYDIEALAGWARREDLPELSRTTRDTFKSELKQALREPYQVTPKLFEKWTGMDVETQQEVQARLQEIWDACFAESEQGD